MTRWEVTKDDVRPARPDGTCFYCMIPIGGRHRDDCVIPTRTWRVKMTVEFDWDEPVSWGAEDVEFHLNDSSWCADNIIAHLEKVAAEHGCLCAMDPQFDAVKIKEENGTAPTRNTKTH